MVEFRCGACKSTEFAPIVAVILDTENKIVEMRDQGMFKCSNCATRYQAGDDGSIVQVESAPSSVARTARVRSSVSADARGKMGPTTNKF